MKTIHPCFLERDIGQIIKPCGCAASSRESETDYIGQHCTLIMNFCCGEQEAHRTLILGACERTMTARFCGIPIIKKKNNKKIANEKTDQGLTSPCYRPFYILIFQNPSVRREPCNSYQDGFVLSEWHRDRRIPFIFLIGKIHV